MYFEGKEGDLAFVIRLVVKKTIAAQTPSRHTFHCANAHDFMRVRLTAVMAEIDDARFRDAYRHQNQAWIKTILTGKPNIGADAWDGYCSTAIADAGVKALHSGQAATVELIAKPKFYNY